MASYIKTLKEDNGDITYPQTKGSAVLLDGGSDLESVLAAKADASTVNQKITVGDVQSTDIVANAVTAAKLASNSVETAKIADGAVTSGKIDWTTVAPYWKTVFASTSTSVTLPAGYHLYRVRLVGRKTSTTTWGVISCPQAAGTTWIYIQGKSAGTWIADERSVTASSDKAVMDGARHGTPTGLQTWDITISKPSITGTECVATWETCTIGSTTFNTGRSLFNVTDGTADMNLYCGLSSPLWSVEVLVED